MVKNNKNSNIGNNADYRKLFTSISVLGILGGFFFLSPTITGHAVGPSVQTKLNWIGLVLIAVGIAFLVLNIIKKPKSKKKPTKKKPVKPKKPVAKKKVRKTTKVKAKVVRKTVKKKPVKKKPAKKKPVKAKKPKISKKKKR